MKILAYGIREDEKPFVKEWEQENPEVEVEITDKLLDEETVAMAKGFDAVFEKLDSYGIHNVSLRNVGVDNMNPATVKKYGFKVTNVPVYSPAAIAEFSVTQLMNLLRRTKEYFHKFERGDFRWAPQISQELNQQTVGVIGTGHIGRVAFDI